ncbi:M48 family metallopeptidase [Novosphingobium flavum]|uniref:M48 family metallopeptidase n=1 Tax=Novosphingobium flavum TaxID=1778672 RepID=A0A7X1FSH4_9SPHN|nr:SprT family zinc-dependent metalloprotease [Novosphingobium flavum]MBC2666024.1 M48 family metallopeptidase [Novosphingobium flavum]
MLDWLRRPAREAPSLDLAGRTLPVEIRRLPHARRLTLRLAPDGSAVRVTMPKWAPTAEAMAFARSRAAWLEAQLVRLPQAEPLLPGSVIPWRGEPRGLVHDPAAARRVRLAGDALHLGGPAESLAPRLKRWMHHEVRALFLADLADYAPRAGVALPALALSNAQRRWGSCSAGGVVRLNWRLGMAPDDVRRSVVAHEVAHLVHFDHSPRFHALLEDIFEGEIDAANAWLKRHGRSLYAPLG